MAGLYSCGSECPDCKAREGQYTDREALETIFSRKSVRQFQGRVVEQDKIDLLMKAGMSAPTAKDIRPWELIVLNDRQAMDHLSEALPYAKMLKQAPMAILVCGNTEMSPNNWYIDCSAATQNILLAAEALGLGAVWTGAYPSEERISAISEALGLPENIVPLNVIPVGYPEGEHQPKDKYDESKIHYNRW